MKVCHVIESGATGAMEMVLLMANVQREMGWEVLVVYSSRPGAPADLHCRVPAGTKLLRLDMSPVLPHLATWCLRFSRLLSRESLDIVHFHGSRAAFWGRLIAGRRYGSHAVHSSHCISLMYLNFSPMRHALYRALEQIAYRVCPALYLPCSELELLTIERELNVKVRLLENSVDEELLAAYLGAPAQNLTVFDEGRGGIIKEVVTCARIADQKDPAAFAAICRAARKRRPDIVFRWVGDGDERQRRMLECAGVQVTGWKSHKDAVHAIAKGCIYLSTSRWEGMPVSILEAMFLGVPVMIPSAEWNAGIIRDGETGRLFDSVQSAVDVLLSADQSWRQAVSQKARHVAKERYSRQRFAKDLMNIYREVIGEEALHPSGRWKTKHRGSHEQNDASRGWTTGRHRRSVA